MAMEQGNESDVHYRWSLDYTATHNDTKIEYLKTSWNSIKNTFIKDIDACTVIHRDSTVFNYPN